MIFKQCLVIFLSLSYITCSKKLINSRTSIIYPDQSFTNPLLPGGPDPWVIQKDTNYYYTNTFGNRIALYKTSKMSNLGKVSPITVWTPPSTGAFSKEIWAPELHFLDDKWYLYFAADDGKNSNHRIYVLENSSSDPTTGTWEMKGKITDPTDRWAIDATVFDYKGLRYITWSGWEGDVNGQQNLYIARMENPWTISGNRVLISTPIYDWEKKGNTPTVNEGPQFLKNKKGHVFLTYSASGCWTDDYALGLLTLKKNGDPMNPTHWSKSITPVFTKKPENNAFAPGHNAFFTSRDGKEEWIIYHANSMAGQGCRNSRNPRMQQFYWNKDGTPNFGEPVKLNTPIAKPAGE